MHTLQHTPYQYTPYQHTHPINTNTPLLSGIWPPDADGTDVNSVDVLTSKGIIYHNVVSY